jgi:hypothetical protein
MELPRPGDRIELIAMPGDPDPISPHSTGTVLSAKRHGSGSRAWVQVDVDWDNGRKLMLSVPPDRFEILCGKTGGAKPPCRGSREVSPLSR